MIITLLRALALFVLVFPVVGGRVAAASGDFLAPEQAFRFEARSLDAHHVEVVFNVADGYYLYRERFAFAADPAAVKLGTPVFPPGQVKYDETFGKKLETHRGRVVIRLPVDSAPVAFTLTVTSQGCADAGLCYAPMQNTAELSLGKTSRNGGR